MGNVSIRENDLLLFKYLFEEKYIHRSFIREYLWCDYHEVSVRRRLSKLLKNDFIRAESDLLSDGSYIFPTEKALIFYNTMFEKVKNIKSRSNSRLKIYRSEEYSVEENYDFKSLMHDKLLTEIRLILENYGVDYWESEKMIYRKYAKNPDGAFIVGKNNAAIEFERNLKRDSRYKNIFTKYADMDNFDLVLYIVEDDYVYNHLSDIIKPNFLKRTDKWYRKFRIMKYKHIKEGNLIMRNEFLKQSNNLGKALEEYLKRQNGRY